MDLFAHLLWTFIIFTGPQLYLCLFFGVMPDIIPFGLNMIVSYFRSRKDPSKKRPYHDHDNMAAYFKKEENLWVYNVYNWTHSLVVWSIVFIILLITGRFAGFFPIFLLAWLFHIAVDIPTHTDKFFAPHFLTPISNFYINGIHWGTRWLMILNYSLIAIFLTIRIVSHFI